LLGGDYWLDSDSRSARRRRRRRGRAAGQAEPDRRRVWLNPVAAWIFDLCDGSNSVAGIAAAIAEKTNQEQADVLTDVKQQLVLFRETGLLDR
jgi:Coenzyme PQQ synthesis protein D (PqqD).